MPRERILIVEDDGDILELLAYNLGRDGFPTTLAKTGEEGLRLAGQDLPGLVLLDLMLPGLDGLEVCRRLKSDGRTAGIPVVMLTAKSEEADIVAGLELGADDYITKPFSPRVLVARIRTVLRRRAAASLTEEKIVKVRDLTVDPQRHEAVLADRRLDLTLTEFRMLHVFLQKPGWALTRHQIISNIQGPDVNVTDRSVDVHIVSLRRKLGTFGDRIEAVRGVGYRFADC